MKSLSWKRRDVCSLLQAVETEGLSSLLSYPQPTPYCMFELKTTFLPQEEDKEKARFIEINLPLVSKLCNTCLRCLQISNITGFTRLDVVKKSTDTRQSSIQLALVLYYFTLKPSDSETTCVSRESAEQE